MITRILFVVLLALCGVGILIAWVPGQVPLYLMAIAIFALVIVWASAWFAGRAEARGPWLLLPFLGIVAWGGVQLRMGWSAYPFATEADLLRWGTYAAAFFLAFQLSGRDGSGSILRRSLSVFALVLAVVSVFQYFLGNGKIYWLFATSEPAGLGPFLNRDHYASFGALALSAAAMEMLRRPRYRWVFALATAVIYASVVAGASRAGFVLLTLELILLFLLRGFSGRTVLAVVGLAIAFGFVVGWATLLERLQIPDPYAGRREVAAATLQMIHAKPWNGYGLGTWTSVYPAFAERDFGVFVNAAHNDWLQWTSDGGVPMLACLLAIFAASCFIAQRKPWTLGVPIVFLHSLVDFPMQGRFLPVLVFVILGVGSRTAFRRVKDKLAPD